MTKPHLDMKEKTAIVTLAADGQPPTRIAKQVGRNPHTVRKFLQEPDTERQVQVEKTALAEIYRDKARRIVESIGEEDIAKASLQQKSISSGVLLDKSLLLSGDMPTVDVHILLACVAEVKAQRQQEELSSTPQLTEGETK